MLSGASGEETSGNRRPETENYRGFQSQTKAEEDPSRFEYNSAVSKLGLYSLTTRIFESGCQVMLR